MKRFRCTTETAFYKDRAFALQGVMIEDPNGEYVLYTDLPAEEKPEVKEVKTGICHECGEPMYEYIRASNWEPEWTHSEYTAYPHQAVESRPEPPRGSVVLWDGEAWFRPAGVIGYRIIGGPLNFQVCPPWGHMYGATVLHEKKEDAS